MTCFIDFSELKEIGKFALCEFRIVREIHLYEDFENGHWVADVVLQSEDRPRNFRFKLHFEGVSRFSVRDFGGGETRVIGLDLADISDRGWEDANVELVDFEHNAIYLVAKRVTAGGLRRLS